MTKESYKIIRNAFCRAAIDTIDSSEVKASYSAAVRDEIMEICKTKKYTPVVADYLMRLDIDYDFWKQQYDFFHQRNEKILGFVKSVFDDFDAKNIKTPFVYENFGALLESDTDIALYASGDVDLCADIKEYKAIIDVMKQHGFVLHDTNVKFYKLFRVCFAGKIGDMDYRVNVMFTPLVRYKLPICIDCKRILNPENFSFYKDTKIRIPSCEVLLYLNMLRTSVHGYVRSPDIRLYIDIYNGSVSKPDWDSILAMAQKDSTVNRIGVVSYIAGDMFFTEIPQFLLDLRHNPKTKINDILEIVYDSKNKCLKEKLSRKEHMKLEFYSDGRSLLGGIIKMIFPDNNWLKEYYCYDGEFIVKGYCRYLKYLIRGKI